MPRLRSHSSENKVFDLIWKSIINQRSLVGFHTQLAEVQEGPVQTDGAGRGQGPNAHLAMDVKPPQGIMAGGQVGHLHLSPQKTGNIRVAGEENMRRYGLGDLMNSFTSGGRGTEEGRSSPSRSHTQNRSFLLWASHRNVPEGRFTQRADQLWHGALQTRPVFC